MVEQEEEEETRGRKAEAEAEAMDLLCCEAQVDFECRAYADPVLIKDVRVLDNLLSSEERHIPSASYFDCVQPDLKPHMRKVVTEWMLEVPIPISFTYNLQKNPYRNNSNR